MSVSAASPAKAPVEHTYPPIPALVVSSLALVIVGGIWMASYFPRRPPLGLPTLLGVLSVVLLATGFLLLARVPFFSWSTFLQVWRWALLAYVVIAGLIEFAFVHNGARGAPLAVVTALLVVFALDVATVIAFTVARYQDSPT